MIPNLLYQILKFLTELSAKCKARYETVIDKLDAISQQITALATGIQFPSLEQILLRLQTLEAGQQELSLQTLDIASKLATQSAKLDRILEAVIPPTASDWELIPFINGVEKEIGYMAILHKGDSVTYKLNTKTGSGKVGAIDGKPEWASAPPEAGTLSISEDGFSATFVGAAVEGDALLPYTVNALVDADITSGIRGILAVASGSIVPADFEATIVELEESAVTPAPVVE